MYIEPTQPTQHLLSYYEALSPSLSLYINLSQVLFEHFHLAIWHVAKCCGTVQSPELCNSGPELERELPSAFCPMRQLVSQELTPNPKKPRLFPSNGLGSKIEKSIQLMSYLNNSINTMVKEKLPLATRLKQDN